MPEGTPRRMRRRLGVKAVSALADADPFDRPQKLLNEATPGVPHCSWPDCGTRLYENWSRTDSNRYGVLCEVHAVDVAIAVLQHQKDLQATWSFFEQQTSARAVRVAEWRAEEANYEAEKAALRKDREGFVYYIQIGDQLKIGYSTDVRRRMRAYPPESKLLAIEPGDRGLERQRHQQFAGSLRNGREWFAPTADLLEHIDAVLAEHGEPPRRMAHHYRAKRQPMRVRDRLA